MITWNSRVFVCFKLRPVSGWPAEPLTPSSYLRGACLEHQEEASTCDQAGTKGPQGPVPLSSAKLSSLPGNSSALFPPQLLSLLRRRSLVPTAQRAALSTSGRCLWKANFNRRFWKQGERFSSLQAPAGTLVLSAVQAVSKLSPMLIGMW